MVYSPSKSFLYNKIHLNQFFRKLEKVGGGDGNGIYAENCDENKPPKIVRDMGMEKIEKTFLDYHRFIFHTRKASHGVKDIRNVHPFETEKYIICHNGVFPGIEQTAKVLGFRKSDIYSDTAMIAYVIDKVGLLNFYIGFNDELFGVILVYDKDKKTMYLLKNGGTFKAIRIDGTYLYASSNLEFWQHDDGTSISFENGWYILNEKSYKQIHKKIKKYYSYRYTYGYDYSEKWEKRKSKKKQQKITKYSSTDDGICSYCNEFIPLDELVNDTYGNFICVSCFDSMWKEYDKNAETPPKVWRNGTPPITWSNNGFWVKNDKGTYTHIKGIEAKPKCGYVYKKIGDKWIQIDYNNIPICTLCGADMEYIYNDIAGCDICKDCFDELKIKNELPEIWTLGMPPIIRDKDGRFWQKSIIKFKCKDFEAPELWYYTLRKGKWRLCHFKTDNDEDFVGLSSLFSDEEICDNCVWYQENGPMPCAYHRKYTDKKDCCEYFTKYNEAIDRWYG